MSNDYTDMVDAVAAGIDRDAAIVRKANPMQPTARRSDAETSHAAAAKAAASAPNGRLVALRLLEACGPMTDFQLAHMSGLQQTSIGKRRGDLCKLGCAENTGITRPAPSGAQAIVWRITESGREYLRSKT